MSDSTENKNNKPGSWYSHYVLFVLVIVYIFNFIDRNILSILYQNIPADLGVTDAPMVFLLGTYVKRVGSRNQRGAGDERTPGTFLGP